MKSEINETSVRINPTGDEETIELFLDPNRHPVAYGKKLSELIKCGLSEDEAKSFLTRTPFVMEVYYSTDQGLFAVESEALDFIFDAYNPYDGRKMERTDD